MRRSKQSCHNKPTRWTWAWCLTTVLVLASAGCQHTEGDYFFLERQGAVMPIWVRGNMEGGTLILVLHGGPGSSAQRYIYDAAFKALERRYAVAYWDQRGSGRIRIKEKQPAFSIHT